MQKILIAAVGSLKERHYQEAVSEYLTRLKPYLKIETKEVAIEPFVDQRQHQEVIKKEGLKLSALINKFIQQNPGAKVLVLDKDGQAKTSEALASFFEKLNAPMVFVIGGSLGLSEEVKGLATHKISLSAMTFPHELARVVLVEQIYRAVMIIKGMKYHY